MAFNNVLSLDFDREYPRIVRGDRIYMYTDDGTEIVDGASGPVLVSLGHGIDEIADAIREQTKQIAFVHRDDCVTPVLEESCKTFTEASNDDLYATFQVCGGSEANEIAIKLARNYQRFRGNQSKYKIIARWQSYHGSSMGVMSISGFGSRKEGYEPYMFEHGHIPPCYCYRCWYGEKPETCGLQCACALESEIQAQGPDSVAAFIAEPVSGMSLCAAPAHPDYFKKIREICDKYDVLLIMDEVMTGWGRTGEMFAYQHYGIVPDMVSTGKAVSGGYYPLAAVSVTKKFYDGYHETGQKFKPGYSWSGNPTGAAAQLAAYSYLKKHDLLDNCRRQGAYLKESLEKLAEKHPIMGDIRGMGLMVGIELVKDKATKEPFDIKLGMAAQVQDECLDVQNMIIEASNGCFKGVAGDANVLSPAFVVSKEEIDMIVDKYDKAVTAVEQRNGIR